MRMTYETRAFQFKPGLIGPVQTPNRIIMHRQGNPGAEGMNGITWMNTALAGSIHSYVDDIVCWDGVPPDRLALHVKASTYAAAMGFRVTDPAWGNDRRGDYDAIGIEMEDESPTSGDLMPGQKYGLSQETRITALLRCAAYMRQYNIPSRMVDEHAAYDPADRPEDVGDALYIPDFRLDLDDLLAGRTPWRTVGRYARGSAAPASWKPAEFDRAEARRLVQLIEENTRALRAVIG